MKTKLIKQIFAFGIVGVISFSLDFGILVFLVSVMELNYFISSFISFTISLIFNYIMNIKYIFVSNNLNKTKEIIIYIIINIIGLVMNQLIMFLTVELLGMLYQLGKVVSTTIVMIYNFISRKILIESNDNYGGHI